MLHSNAGDGVISEHIKYFIETAGLLLGSVVVMWWFRVSISRPLKEARRLAREVAACNLSTQISIVDAPEPAGSLLRSLAQIQVNLQAIVSDVRREIDNFSETAVEIALATDDLSKRTESQAASLEETAASMEQLAATVRSTADNSSEMARQTAHSTEVARSGQRAIHAVADSMGEIEQSSRKMREIISTIESIAFQTNILALNAAVEAARAGDQGRGFAVVAGEVRSLAQRTTEASKDIRGLIQTSVNQVSEGSGQMKTAITVDEVVKEIQDASVLVKEILSATNEQSEGLLQINQAVVQLDTVTQQNAAMVEQTGCVALAEEGRAESVDGVDLRLPDCRTAVPLA